MDSGNFDILKVTTKVQIAIGKTGNMRKFSKWDQMKHWSTVKNVREMQLGLDSVNWAIQCQSWPDRVKKTS